MNTWYIITIHNILLIIEHYRTDTPIIDMNFEIFSFLHLN